MRQFGTKLVGKHSKKVYLCGILFNVFHHDGHISNWTERVIKLEHDTLLLVAEVLPVLKAKANYSHQYPDSEYCEDSFDEH